MLKEYSEEKGKLSSYIPWICLIDKGVVLNKNGTLQKTLKYRGYDLDSSTVYELKNINAKLNDVIKRLGQGWSLNVEARRKRCADYIEAKNEILAIDIIEKERKLNFLENEHFESEYYLTIVQLIPTDNSKKVGEIFLEYAKKSEILDKTLENFNKEFKKILNLFKEIFLEVTELDDEETYTYLHSCVSTKTDKVIVPEIPYAMANYLCDSDLVGGLKPKLRGKEIRCISIQGFPNYTVPGFFDVLNRLNIPYRWITRFLILSKLEALSKMERKYKNIFSQRLSLFQRVYAELTGEKEENSRKLNEDALNKANEVRTQIALTTGDYVSQGFYTCTLIVDGDSIDEVEERVDLISKTINNMGFITIEESINSVEAFLGSIPGNITNNIRMPILNTITLSHLLPVSSVWGGDSWNKHLNAPPLIYTKTKGSTPFRFNIHIEDIGHSAIVGPTGYGKSVLLGLIASSFIKYKDSRVYFFDKDLKIVEIKNEVSFSYNKKANREGSGKIEVFDIPNPESLYVSILHNKEYITSGFITEIQIGNKAVSISFNTFEALLKNYKLPKIFNGFKGMSEKEIITNLFYSFFPIINSKKTDFSQIADNYGQNASLLPNVLHAENIVFAKIKDGDLHLDFDVEEEKKNNFRYAKEGTVVFTFDLGKPSPIENIINNQRLSKRILHSK